RSARCDLCSVLSGAIACLDATPPLPTSTLSLHDALPISFEVVIGHLPHGRRQCDTGIVDHQIDLTKICPYLLGMSVYRITVRDRSEEHTSELQSRENLVCRLLLEKKK